VPWQLIDYPVRRLSVAAPSTGLAIIGIPFGVVPNNQAWRIDQVSLMVINLDQTQVQQRGAPPVVELYDLAPAPGVIPAQATQLALYVDIYNGFVFADYDDQGSPLTIRGGDQLTIVFNSIFAPNVCLTRVQYQVVQNVAGEPQPVAGSQPAPPIPWEH